MAGIREYLVKHERIIGPLFFITGFIVDNLTLTRIDRIFDNIILLSYLVLALIAILVINKFQSGGLATASLLLMQYAFGGLFSGYLIFYTRASTFVASWVFIFILVILFIANERLRESYSWARFQIGIYYVALFSYLVFSVPVLIGRMDEFIFILSGVISLVIISYVIKLIRWVNPFSVIHLVSIWFLIGAIFVGFNFLYFTNIIPPVPLSLKESVVAHSVRKIGSQYEIKSETYDWWR